MAWSYKWSLGLRLRPICGRGLNKRNLGLCACQSRHRGLETGKLFIGRGWNDDGILEQTHDGSYRVGLGFSVRFRNRRGRNLRRGYFIQVLVEWFQPFRRDVLPDHSLKGGGQWIFRQSTKARCGDHRSGQCDGEEQVGHVAARPGPG